MLSLLLILACSPKGQPVESIRGTLSWTVDFDAAAEAEGFEDCTYSRRYEGLTDRSAPWLCPECDTVFRVEAKMKNESCFQGISGGEPASDVEWLGWSGRRFFRTSTENYRLSEQGTARGAAEKALTYRGDPIGAGGGSFELVMSGELRVGSGVGDPMWGFEPPEGYACGWHQEDLPAYEGDWRLQSGEGLPDGWFKDACGESVRLHDQLGAWLVVAVSAEDCPPCQQMAMAEEAFLGRMEDAGLQARVVTLLAPSLTSVIDPTPRRILDDWTQVFGLSNPVLADRGWGFWLGEESLGHSFAYPMVLLVDPDGTVIQLRTGYDSWDPIFAVFKDVAG